VCLDKHFIGLHRAQRHLLQCQVVVGAELWRGVNIRMGGTNDLDIIADSPQGMCTGASISGEPWSDLSVVLEKYR
jgi:hypothetical protein